MRKVLKLLKSFWKRLERKFNFKSRQMSDLVKKWKEAGVSQAHYEFSCGGDSMNETDLIFYDENESVIDGVDFESELEDLIYKRVDFYEASDGHYMGESGKVVIYLDDEDELTFEKESMSEWCEDVTEQILVPLTDEEKAFIDEYVISINDTRWDGAFENYKKDFILNDKLEATLKSIKSKFNTFSHKIFDMIEDGEVHDDSTSYTTDVNEDNTIKYEIVDGVTNIVLSVSVEVYIYKDEEN